MVDKLITIIIAIIASTGFWTFIQTVLTRKSASTKMILGLGHDRIVWLGMQYINRGWITKDEYENLHDFLYTPYEKMGGNGSAKRVMDEVKKLPIRPATYSAKED